MLTKLRIERNHLLAIAGLLLVTGVYVFDAGHGFVKDDFHWILTSRLQRADDLPGLFGAATGFFRPVVALSFAANYTLFDRHPLGYGLTNLILLLMCVGVVTQLMRAMGFDTRVAAGMALLWSLNFQGIGMAVLWISGRTALLVTFFSVAAAWAWMRGRRAGAAMLALAAMWSKEEALVLPAILSVWSFIDSRRARRVIGDTWLVWLAAAVSLVSRTLAGAFTPATAPDIYRYQLDAVTLWANVVAYADRVATTPLLALLVFWLAAGRPPVLRALGAGRSDRVWKGAAWVVLCFAPTILLPVRSSLYAVLPSVGVALIVGEVAQRAARRATPASLARAALVVSLLFVALVPVYRVRNQRLVREAELSAAIVGHLSDIRAAHPQGGLVVVNDIRDERPTAEQAFGPLADSAAALVTDGTIRLWIDPPPAELAGVQAPDLSASIATLEVRGGTVRRVR